MQKDMYLCILRKITLGEIRFYLKVFSLVFEVRCFELERKIHSWIVYILHAGTLRPGSLTEAWIIDFSSVGEFLFCPCPCHLLKREMGIHIDYSMTLSSKCEVKVIYSTHALFLIFKFPNKYY